MCFFISENETAASNAFVNDCVGELVGSGKTVLTLFDPDPFFEGEFEFRPLFVLEPFGVLSLSSASVPQFSYFVVVSIELCLQLFCFETKKANLVFSYYFG